MTLNELHSELQYVNHSREKRLYYVNVVECTPGLLEHLVTLVFRVDDPLSARAAWLLDYICDRHINSILPHLDYFTKHINQVHIESSIRPLAKICERITEAYYVKTNLALRNALKPHYIERIINNSFDYLITDVKVAPKAYSMRVLFLFGQDFSWIYPELVAILEKDYALQSAAYQARARQIFKALKKQKMS